MNNEPPLLQRNHLRAPGGMVDERPLGEILIGFDSLKPRDIDKVLRIQNRRGLPFGEAAHSLGLVKRADIQRALAAQFGYPPLSSGATRLSEELVVAYRPFSEQGEALRNLRSQLLLHWFKPAQSILAIVSSRPSDGRSFAAANLAVAFSQWGHKTLLIDADLRTPRQHEIFDLENRIGLSSILSGRSNHSAIQSVSHFVNLDVLTAGPTPSNPVELFGRMEFSTLLTQVEQLYDVVLLDTAAAVHGADAQIAASIIGGVMIVARQDTSRLDEVEMLIDRLSNSGTQIVGAALNRH